VPPHHDRPHQFVQPITYLRYSAAVTRPSHSHPDGCGGQVPTKMDTSLGPNARRQNSAWEGYLRPRLLSRRNVRYRMDLPDTTAPFALAMTPGPSRRGSSWWAHQMQKLQGPGRRLSGRGSHQTPMYAPGTYTEQGPIARHSRGLSHQLVGGLSSSDISLATDHSLFATSSHSVQGPGNGDSGPQ